MVLQQAHGAAVRAATGAEHTRTRTLWAVVGVMLAMAVGLGIGTVFLLRSICRPMDQLTAIARRIGDGDLDVEIDTRRNDEIGAVQQSLAAVRDALRGIVGQVRESAESILVASKVLSLAQCSDEAAREIKTLIGTGVQKVETGARLVQDAGSTMDEIVSSVQRAAGDRRHRRDQRRRRRAEPWHQRGQRRHQQPGPDDPAERRTARRIALRCREP